MGELEKSAASYSMEEFAEDGEADHVSEVPSEQIDEDISEVASEEYSEDFERQKSHGSDSHQEYSESFADGTLEDKGRGSEELEEGASGALSASEDVGASSASASASARVGITATRGVVNKVEASPAPPAPVGIAAASVHVGDTEPPAAEEYSQQSYEEDFAEGTVDTAGFSQSLQSRSESQEVSQSASARTQERRRVAEEEEKARKSEEQDMRDRIEQRRRQIAEQQQQQQLCQQDVRMPSVKEEFPSPLAKAAEEDASGRSLSLLPKADEPDAKSAKSEVSELDEDVDEIIEESDEDEMKSKQSTEDEAEQSSWEAAKRKADEEMKSQGEAEELRRQWEVAELANRESRQKAEEEEEEQERRRVEEEARCRAEEQAKRDAEEEARRKAEQEAQQEAISKAEEDAKRMAEEEANNRVEEEVMRKAQEEERCKVDLEERRKAEEEEKRKSEEEERRKSEMEKKQIFEDEEKKRKSEEEERWKSEREERRKLEEEDEKRKSEEEERRKSEQQRKQKSEEEEEERRKIEDKKKQKVDEDAMWKAAEESSRKAEEEANLEAKERCRREEELHRQVENKARSVIEQPVHDARGEAEQIANESAAIQDETAEMPCQAAPLDVELSIKPKRRLAKAIGPSGQDVPKGESLSAESPRDLASVAAGESKTQPFMATEALHLSMEAPHGSESAAPYGKEKEEEGWIQTQAGKYFARDDKENWHESTSGNATCGHVQDLRRSRVNGIELDAPLKSEMVANRQAEPQSDAHDEAAHQNLDWKPVAQKSKWDSSWLPGGDQYQSYQQWTHADLRLHDYNKQGGNSSWWTSQNSWWNRSAERWKWAHSSWHPGEGLQWSSSDRTDFHSWGSHEHTCKMPERGRSEERQDVMHFRSKQNFGEEEASWALHKQPQAVAPRIAWGANSAGRDGSSGDAFIGAESTQRLMRSLGKEAFFASGWDPDALYRRSDTQAVHLQDPLARVGESELRELRELRQAKELRELREAKEMAERASAEAQKKAQAHQEMAERALAEARKSMEDRRAASKLAEGEASAPDIQVESKGTSTDAEGGIVQWQIQSLEARESSLLQADLLTLSDLSPQEFGKFAIQAIGEVAHDLMELKYNTGLDIDEFVERGTRACGEYALLSVPRLLQKLNSETQLKFLDRRREQMLQLRLDWRVVNDFDSLRRTVRLVPGTASAVAIITAGGGHALDVVAVFRVAYSDAGMIVGRSGRGGRQPLRHFGDADLCGAVAIDPVILSMCPVNAPLSGVTPAPVPEYVSLEALLQDGCKTSATAPNSSTSRVPQSLLAVMHSLAPTADVFKKVAEVLERPDVEPESLLEVMAKLVEWLKREPQATLARRGLAASKGHAGIVAALRRHRSQCAFAASACRVIGWASRHHVENAVLFVECRAATDICSVLEMHRADKDLHRHGLYAIGCLSHYGGGAAQAVSAGALGIVHRSLGMHRDSPSVQINGCEVLRCLAESGDAPMEDLGRVALDAKRAFPRDQTVHRAADALLTLVVPRTVCAVTMLMDTQLADAEVQNSGARTLGQLAAYGGVAWRGAAAGAVSRISRAMSLHRENVALQAVGLWALGRLAERVEAPSAGMYDAAARAKATHPESALVQRHAGQLLAYLSSRPS